jgi:hypothetical protein
MLQSCKCRKDSVSLRLLNQRLYRLKFTGFLVRGIEIQWCRYLSRR